MSENNLDISVLELQVALTVRDFQRSPKFYSEGLGFEPADTWNNSQGQALIFEMGNATLEIFDETQAHTVNQIKAGQRVSGQIRFALQVPDLNAAMERLLSHGAIVIHPPDTTSWSDINVRLQSSEGMQITLFRKS